MATKSNFPNNSFMNLFKNIIYDKDTLANPTLDIWDAWAINPVTKQDLTKFIVYKIKEGDTWVGLALQMYNDPRLWWILPLFNNIEDPFIIKSQDLFTDGITEIKILSKGTVDQMLFAARRQKIINDQTVGNS